jgi:predicted nucleic acid-binding Zn ribbon protein
VNAAIEELMRTQPLSQGKAEFAWRMAVGARIARASTVRLTKGGVLQVEAADARWAREIQNLSDTILARLTSLLGPDTVRRLAVVNAALSRGL